MTAMSQTPSIGHYNNCSPQTKRKNTFRMKTRTNILQVSVSSHRKWLGSLIAANASCACKPWECNKCSSTRGQDRQAQTSARSVVQTTTPSTWQIWLTKCHLARRLSPRTHILSTLIRSNFTTTIRCNTQSWAWEVVAPLCTKAHLIDFQQLFPTRTLCILQLSTVELPATIWPTTLAIDSARDRAILRTPIANSRRSITLQVYPITTDQSWVRSNCSRCEMRHLHLRFLTMCRTSNRLFWIYLNMTAKRTETTIALVQNALLQNMLCNSHRDHLSASHRTSLTTSSTSTPSHPVSPEEAGGWSQGAEASLRKGRRASVDPSHRKPKTGRSSSRPTRSRGQKVSERTLCHLRASHKYQGFCRASFSRLIWITAISTARFSSRNHKINEGFQLWGSLTSARSLSLRCLHLSEPFLNTLVWWTTCTCSTTARLRAPPSSIKWTSSSSRKC